MNSKQKRFLIGGLVVIACLTLYPQYQITNARNIGYVRAGLFSNPIDIGQMAFTDMYGRACSSTVVEINVARMAIEFMFVGLLTALFLQVDDRIWRLVGDRIWQLVRKPLTFTGQKKHSQDKPSRPPAGKGWLSRQTNFTVMILFFLVLIGWIIIVAGICSSFP